jgi:uncharacterized protein YegL
MRKEMFKKKPKTKPHHKAHDNAHKDAEGTTVITMLVDESYSMLPVTDATINGFNEYVKTVAGQIKGRSYFSAITFDTRGIRKLQVGAPLAQAISLGRHNYVPTGGTPLLDAMMQAIRATDEVMAQQRGTKAIVVIQTDGEENSSVECKLDTIKLAITQRQEQGWQFVFIGAGIDAFMDAQRMGIDVRNTMSYQKTGHHTGQLFGAMAHNTVAYSRGMSQNMAFTACQSADAGEDPHTTLKKMAAGPVPVQATTAPVDLTTPT